jgi:hypothetical protein
MPSRTSSAPTRCSTAPSRMLALGVQHVERLTHRSAPRRARHLERGLHQREGVAPKRLPPIPPGQRNTPARLAGHSRPRAPRMEPVFLSGRLPPPRCCSRQPLWRAHPHRVAEPRTCLRGPTLASVRGERRRTSARDAPQLAPPLMRGHEPPGGRVGRASASRYSSASASVEHWVSLSSGHAGLGRRLATLGSSLCPPNTKISGEAPSLAQASSAASCCSTARALTLGPQGVAARTRNKSTGVRPRSRRRLA